MKYSGIDQDDKENIQAANNQADVLTAEADLKKREMKALIKSDCLKLSRTSSLFHDSLSFRQYLLGPPVPPTKGVLRPIPQRRDAFDIIFAALDQMMGVNGKTVPFNR